MDELGKLLGRPVDVEFLEGHQAVVRHFLPPRPAKGRRPGEAPAAANRGRGSYPSVPESQSSPAWVSAGWSTASTESTTAEAKELNTTPMRRARVGSSCPRARPSANTKSAAASAPPTAASCAGKRPVQEVAAT